jgi:hypothetical protein
VYFYCRVRGRIAIGLVLVASTTPAAGAEPGSALVLRWERVPGAQEYALEIAEDPEFERIVLERRVPHAAYRFLPPSDEISYFFRVAAVDELGRLGRFSRARAIQRALPAPRVREPADGATIEHREAPPSVTLAWVAVAKAAGYRLDVARSHDFTDATEQRVAGTSLAWKPTGLGVHFWRVVALDKSGLAGRPSPARRIDVRLAAPRLTQPHPGEMVAWVDPKTSVTLLWVSGPAERFEIQLAGDARFRRKRRRLTSVKRTAAVELSQPAAIYWRVRGVEPTGRASPWGSGHFEVREPTILLEQPPDGTEIKTSGKHASVKFSWPAVTNARSYILTATSAGGKETRAKTAKPTARIDLPVKRFSWGVVALDRRGRRIAFSRERDLTIVYRMPPPRLVSPDAGAGVAVLEPGATVDLAWEPVPGADSYEAELAAAESFADAERHRSSAPEVAVPVVSAGDRFWRVRAVGGDWSEARRFSAQPVARRAEITSEPRSSHELALVVTAVDATGAGVPGLAIAGSATAGWLGPFADRGDGSYVATWNGEGRATVSAVGPFGLEATTEVETLGETLYVGARAGVLTNISADTSPHLLVEASYKLPWLQRRLYATLAVGYAYSRKSFKDIVLVSADLHRLPITAGIGYRYPLSSFLLFGTLGLACDPFIGAVAVEGKTLTRETGVVVGGELAAGASHRLGPGLALVELALRATSSWDGPVSLGGAALVATVGYQMAVF